MEMLWNSSNPDRMPLSIFMESPTLGSSMRMDWKRRSSARSFSMVLYSSVVVAPMTWRDPRLSAGLRIFAASSDPSAEPAPTTVCISSMKRMISFSHSTASLMMSSNRCSNSPRYFVPATREPMFRMSTRLFLRELGTLPWAIRCASPSTMAVFPTPGSPMSTGLFFVLRFRM